MKLSTKAYLRLQLKNFKIICGFYRQNFLLWNFFYQNVSNSSKKQMVEDLRTYPLGYALELDYEDYLWDIQNQKYENGMKCSEKLYAFDANGITDLCDKYLSYFINQKSCKFFERFKIHIEILEHSPEKWGRRRSFTQSRNKISQLRVVTDCAERAVHLTQRYVNNSTHDEKQKQYFIQ